MACPLPPPGSLHPYASKRYAEALAGRDAAIDAPEWGTHLIRRSAPGGLHDATGVYPLHVFARDADVGAGLERLAAEGLVSVVLTPDPLLHPADTLARAFEVRRPFKPHYLVDRARGPFDPSKHHLDRMRRARRRCRVEWTPLADHLPAWTALYAGLVERRGVTGVADFGPVYPEALSRDPAMQAVGAWVCGELAGLAIWFEAEGVAYYHLCAVNRLGYANGAAYGLVAAGIDRFGDASVIHLGGGAGAEDGAGGLAAFKQGFANAEVIAHVCGAVLDPTAYERLSAGRSGSGFFPAYRAPDRAVAAVA